jgi:RNA polymerase sigma factor (sigma-70 family)
MNEQQQALFDSHMGLAGRVASKYSTKGRDDEVNQESLIALHKAVLTHDPARGAFEPFAWTVVENHVLSFLRRRNRYEGAELTILDAVAGEETGDCLKDAIPDERPHPALEAERNEAFAELHAGIAAATPGQRELLEHYGKGGSFAEWARKTGTTEQAVRQMFQRAKEPLRARFQESPIRALPNINTVQCPQIPEIRKPTGPFAEMPGCLLLLAVCAFLAVVFIILAIMSANP